MTDQRARELWKAITDEMFLAKRSGMTPQELAVFTDRRAVEILLTALADERRRAKQEVISELEEMMCDQDILSTDDAVWRFIKKAHAGQEGDDET